VLIVNDGFEDKGRILEVCNKQNFQYLQHDSNKGKGAAVQTGMLNAKGNVCVFTDIDVPYKMQNMLDMIYAVRNGETEVAIGDRSLKQSEFYNKTPFYRNAGSRIFSLFVRSFAVRGFKDTQCGLKVFSSDVVPVLFSTLNIQGFAFDVEILKKCRKNNIVVLKFPVHFRKREASSVTLVKTLKMIIDVLKIAVK